jgi:protein subunit release factor A
LIDGLKRSLEQNKEIFKAIHETKVMHESFQKEVQKKIDDISEKIDQLMIPDDSYWRVSLLIIIVM